VFAWTPDTSTLATLAVYMILLCLGWCWHHGVFRGNKQYAWFRFGRLFKPTGKNCFFWQFLPVGLSEICFRETNKASVSYTNTVQRSLPPLILTQARALATGAYTILDHATGPTNPFDP
jgi:hypothetical protein